VTEVVKGYRILVVEDEGLVAMLLEDMLADLGHHVVATAGTFEKAAKSAAEADIDVAVLDLNLNGRETYVVAETLSRRGIPFVFATGYASTGVRSDWQHVPVVQKPFQLGDLEHALRAVTRPAG
jgi:CheY-like chemotaxis protein